MKALLFVIAASAVLAGTPLTIPDIIKTEGEFAFTDGSSVYRFAQDGAFHMEPLSLCGRAIEGRWTSGSQGLFMVTGVWTWYNGISIPDDFRRMTMAVTLIPGEPDTVRTMWSGSATMLYPVYFTIDEVADIDSLPGR
ncbi:MAG: hypothetical protein R6V62_07995 [Candidatus Fermentibacteraceae bacterium]